MTKKSPRAEAAAKWQRVANGELDDPELRSWLVLVAKDILSANEEPEDNDRRLGYAKALRLTGPMRAKTDPYQYTELMGFGREQLPPAEYAALVRKSFAERKGEVEYLTDPSARNRVDKAMSVARKALREAKPSDHYPDGDGDDFDPDQQ